MRTAENRNERIQGLRRWGVALAVVTPYTTHEARDVEGF